MDEYPSLRDRFNEPELEDLSEDELRSMLAGTLYLAIHDLGKAIHEFKVELARAWLPIVRWLSGLLK